MGYFFSYDGSWTNFTVIWIVLLSISALSSIVFAYYVIRMCNIEKKRKREYYAAQVLIAPPTTASDYNHTVQPAPLYYLYPIPNGFSPSPAAPPTSAGNPSQQQAFHHPMPTNGSQPVSQVPLAYGNPDAPFPLNPPSVSTPTPASVDQHPEPSPQKDSH